AALTSPACVDYIEEPLESSNGGHYEYGWLSIGQARWVVTDFRTVTDPYDDTNPLAVVRLDEAADIPPARLAPLPIGANAEYGVTVYGFGSDGATCARKPYFR